MKKYIYISIGGFVGAILRFVIENINLYDYTGIIPIKTLVINISGSFLLAFISTIFLNILNRHLNIQLMLCTGFLGAFTTFSTLCKETSLIFSNGHFSLAIFYALMSLVLGLLFSLFGVLVGNFSIKKIKDNFRKQGFDNN
ncbi:CrcB protein [Clostridium algifaecis]|uniref:Fluoride-specific ion channel FluC n=1 Tax=Clostridium algifaecis TaxID=1472040 RepID=A0ABS4KPZ9_9CLOT|nr:CrcB family protein [Clostridium algifaecis]MBP2032116.1 CrcB protein [Clostridium algifaecis]